ncbi:MAG: D-glycero-beta-D-manno-heptose 1-phosphate adenylyltransferase, partial [Planctomycetota bacterium]|nr:D-glycero-beta-D-manno-heptose 1-phosphate adenylyltransferase [Planctomycetota bacterium]
SFSSYRLGGAGNVAANIVSVGGTATCLGVIGDDEDAARLEQKLAAAGIDTAGLVRDALRSTTVKTRFVSRTQQVLRVDEETIRDLDGKAEQEVLAFLDEQVAEFDVVVVSDYGKGALSLAVLRAVIDQAHQHGVPVLVDPKGRDYARYAGATLVTPNMIEAEQATGMTIGPDPDLDRLAEVATALAKVAELETVVITLGKDGIYYRTRDAQHAILPTEARAVFDVTGAGDTVVGLLAYGIGAGLALQAAIRLANLAAGIVVGRFGTATVTGAELRGLLGETGTGKQLDAASLALALVGLRRDSKRIVFTNGCFDLLHPGHLAYLKAARAYGDLLIVGVNDDASIQRLKGESRPVCPLADRLALLAGLEVVDYVVPFGDDTPLELIELISPDVLVKGEDWRDKGVIGREWVEAHGGQVVLVPLETGYSSTALIDHIRGLSS